MWALGMGGGIGRRIRRFGHFAALGSVDLTSGRLGSRFFGQRDLPHQRPKRPSVPVALHRCQNPLNSPEVLAALRARAPEILTLLTC